MVDLPWDLEWVESDIQESLLEYEGWSPMGAGHGVGGEHVERFSGVLPESVLYVWRRFGFDGFADGRFWITDPLVLAPVVDAWVEGTALPFPDQKWWCLNRTAMGDMQLWGEISGPALDVDPILGTLWPSAGDAADMDNFVMRERMGCLTFTSPLKDSFEDEVSGRLVVDEAIERLGPVGEGQVYGFTPAYCFTGRMEARLLGVEDAIAHLVFLAQAQDHQLGQDFSAAAAQIAAQIATQNNPEGPGDPGSGSGGGEGPGGEGGVW